jgi:hypothetical protein
MTSNNDGTLTFKAEVIEVKSKKTASLDVTYRVVLQTDDAKILALGAVDPMTMLTVKVFEDDN